MNRTGMRPYYALAIAVFVIALALAASTLASASRADAASPAPAVTVSARAALAAPTVDNPRINMQVDGLNGESTVPGYEGWIDLLSVKWGATQSTDGGRARIIELDELVVAMKFERAAIKLTESVLIGRIAPKVEIHLTKTINGQRLPYLTYELTNVRIVGFDTSAAKRPKDVYRLVFEEIKATYTEYDSNGQPQGNSVYEYEVEPAA